MLSPAKLAANNLASLCEMLNALAQIRDDGGFGSIHAPVKDGKVMYVEYTVRHNLDEKETP